MRVLLWHVHGSYTTSLVQGRHEYLLPTLPDRGEWGRGRAQTWEWPAAAREVTPQEAHDSDVDVVILQRPEELDHLAEAWLGGRRPGRDVPAVYLEHNAPQGRINDMRHPAADRAGITLVHVTHFNALFWDAGTTASRVVEHGIVDPGHRYTGDLDHAVVVVNEPVRRARVTGTDLIASLTAASGVPVDIFGMKSEPLGGTDVPQSHLHEEMARRRVYLHPVRWTSLGLSLLEAMHLGLPVVGLATTEVADAVPPEAGVVSNDPAKLADALRRLVHDPEEAAVRGKAARAAALGRFGLERFLRDWDDVLQEVTA
ncbi:MAG: Glycosyltransferase [uncultured Acidimicrobiales bacterium]|uniref:Glycosyltransferase n=1 Tax=uncultured Acidimicrobiales bacterium TaxID=310071 RepID=A0A6J4IA59_9ACTN|nr:MAG: Glycosyltransferase [uncultured Acidimicrobiales bacterium]